MAFGAQPSGGASSHAALRPPRLYYKAGGSLWSFSGGL